MVAETQCRMVCNTTGRQRISFRAGMFGPRPVYEVEHLVSYYTTNPYQQPKIGVEWIRTPLWKAYALTFHIEVPK